ncbi:MAG: hypothetical protein ACK5L3_05900, partial [Oscillospiraceae bacterium]
MYKAVGFANRVLVLLLLLPSLLRKLNQWFFNSQSALYLRRIKFLRTLNKTVGAILLGVIAVTG